jgi:hypothetical protein
VVLERPVEKDEPIMLADVQHEADRFDYTLFRRALEASAGAA